MHHARARQAALAGSSHHGSSNMWLLWQRRRRQGQRRSIAQPPTCMKAISATRAERTLHEGCHDSGW